MASQNTTSCTITGTNGFSSSGTSGSQPSGTINQVTTFTLSCADPNNPGQFLYSQATVKMKPFFNEH
jgi:hypothetical protein